MQQAFQPGDLLEVKCTSGNAFSSATSFTRTKTLECQSNGAWAAREADLVDAVCTRTCPVRYSDHSSDVAVPVGSSVQATCKPGYAMQATSSGQTFSTCDDSRDLQAFCQQATTGSVPRLNFECMKVTCGTLTAYPLSVVTVDPPANSRYSDYNDENGLERERTKVTCGEDSICCRTHHLHAYACNPDTGQPMNRNMFSRE